MGPRGYRSVMNDSASVIVIANASGTEDAQALAQSALIVTGATYPFG